MTLPSIRTARNADSAGDIARESACFATRPARTDPFPRRAAAASTSSRLVMCPTRKAVSAIARACGNREQYAQIPDLGGTEVRDDTPNCLHPSSVQPLGQAVQTSRQTDHRSLVKCPLKCIPRDHAAQLACPRHPAHRPPRLHDCHVTESCRRRHKAQVPRNGPVDNQHVVGLVVTFMISNPTGLASELEVATWVKCPELSRGSCLLADLEEMKRRPVIMERRTWTRPRRAVVGLRPSR